MTKPKLALKFKKMKNLSVIIICLFNFYLATAQPQDLEKVDLEMLHKTQSSIDPNASAEILYERGEISFVIIKGERKYPVDFTFPKAYTYGLQIDLPESYAIDYNPEKTVYKMENDTFISLI